MPRCLVAVLFLLAALPVPAAVTASARADFLAAERALATGDLASYRTLRARLADYPLAGYLDVAALRPRLDTAAPAEVRAVLERVADSPIADDLRRAWIESLARRGEWALLRAAYRPGLGVTAECHHARALFETGSADLGAARARALWLHGASRPRACDAVFETWSAAGGLTPALAWERTALAIRAGQEGLVRHLLPSLAPDARAAGALWLAARAEPSRLERATPAGAQAAFVAAEALAYAARRNPSATAMLWERLRRVYAFDDAAAGRVERSLAVMLAVERDPLARTYFARLPALAWDEPTREWAARAALAAGDWAGVLEAIGAMPPELAAKARWQYWRGRALEALGRAGAADAYRAAAGQREFHGFLAAERLGLPPALGETPTPPDSALQAAIAAWPGVVRARELAALARRREARREWEHALRDRPPPELAQAMLLAHAWGWPAQAIALATRAGRLDDLRVRFPVVYEAEVARAAAVTGLDAALIRAIMRRESALDPAARSHADARGLMQLLPGTGARVARTLGETFRREDLYDPVVNIRYGSHYFAAQLARFGGHPALAAAAYNAGPGRVERWLGSTAQPADVWIELIPFGETREYVSAVLAYAVIYAVRAGGPVPRLEAWLAAVPAAATLAACAPAARSAC